MITPSLSLRNLRFETARTLSRLRNEGLVVVRGKTITVPSPAKLRALLKCRRGE